MLHIKLNYVPPNWNEYIKKERASMYQANELKQNEKLIVKCEARNTKYLGGYPIEIIVIPHYDSYRQDLDNFRYKGLLDGLVNAGVIENDNLRHIRKVTLDPVFDDLHITEIIIKQLTE